MKGEMMLHSIHLLRRGIKSTAVIVAALVCANSGWSFGQSGGTAVITATSELKKLVCFSGDPCVRVTQRVADDGLGNPQHAHQQVGVGGGIREYESYEQCTAGTVSQPGGILAKSCTVLTSGYQAEKICTIYNPSCCWYRGWANVIHDPAGDIWNSGSSPYLESFDGPHCGAN